SKMHVYIMGKTPVYQYAMPLVLFTNSAIPEGATVEQAAAIVRANGKPTVWHQAQIHPNEPASGEGALVMMQEMTGSYGETLLSSINVVIVPRINPDGSYLYRRTTYQGFDMNRDHMALKAPELAMLHTNYMLFMPELCVDGHEFGYTGVDASGPFMRNADDMQSTPASSLNNDPKLNAMSLAAVDKLHLDAADNGLRIYHYGTTVNNPIGRAYYGLFNSVSVLVETRGIGGGKSNFPRRVYSQVSAAKSLYEYAAANAASLRSVVATGRQQVIEHGKTYDETDLLALYQTASGKTMSPRKLTRTQYNLDGTVHKTSSAALKMNDTIAQSRVRPTAYLLSKSAGDLLNLDRTLYILDNQGAEYYEIAPGATVNLQQYYNTGIWKDQKGKDTNTPKVELRAPADISFPRGAVVVPMDQVA
ncbi:MAG: M14 family metallocarboxypeptidase, partial [Oscillospiraceae bacterium]